MQGAGCYSMLCKNICSCEVNKLERQFYLVDARVLPEVFLKVYHGSIHTKGHSGDGDHRPT